MLSGIARQRQKSQSYVMKPPRNHPPACRTGAEGEEMKNRGNNVTTRLAPQRARKLRAHEALAELERAQKVFLQSSDKESGRHLNDDKSPLIDLISCIVCKKTMKLEKSAPDAEGRDIIQYRCDPCSRIERVRLFRRSRDSAG